MAKVTIDKQNIEESEVSNFLFDTAMRYLNKEQLKSLGYQMLSVTNSQSIQLDNGMWISKSGYVKLKTESIRKRYCEEITYEEVGIQVDKILNKDTDLSEVGNMIKSEIKVGQ